jgi:Alpha amylase inhibitor
VRKRSTLVVGGLLLAGVLASSTPAQAAESETGTLAAPPSCVQVYGPPAVKSALVRNTCSTTQRVKVVINNGPDSDCYVLSPGEEELYEWWFGSYDGLRTC